MGQTRIPSSPDLSLTPHSYPTGAPPPRGVGTSQAHPLPCPQLSAPLTCGAHGRLGHFEGAAPGAEAVSTVTAASLQTSTKVSIRCTPSPSTRPVYPLIPPKEPGTTVGLGRCPGGAGLRPNRTPSRRLTLFFSTEKVAEQPVQLPGERQHLT